MSVNRAVGIAAATDETELRSSYERAVSHGAANTLCTPEEESAHGTLRLLTLATLRLPDLYLYGYLLEAVDEDPSVEPMPRIVTSRLGEIAAGALRLAHRALETHAHELGYERDVWVERAVEHARAQLSGDLECARRPLVDRARRCSIALLDRPPRSRSRARSRLPPPRQCSYPASSPTDWRVCSRST